MLVGTLVSNQKGGGQALSSKATEIGIREVGEGSAFPPCPSETVEFRVEARETYRRAMRMRRDKERIFSTLLPSCS